MGELKYKLIDAFMSGAAIFLIGTSVLPHFDRHEYFATVIDKYLLIGRVGDHIETKKGVVVMLESGKERILENTDSLLGLKLNSSELQDELKVGQEYKIESYGWKMPFLFIHENISKANKLY